MNRQLFKIAFCSLLFFFPTLTSSGLLGSLGDGFAQGIGKAAGEAITEKIAKAFDSYFGSKGQPTSPAEKKQLESLKQTCDQYLNSIIQQEYKIAWHILTPKFQREIGSYKDYSDWWRTHKSVKLIDIQVIDMNNTNAKVDAHIKLIKSNNKTKSIDLKLSLVKDWEDDRW